MRTKHFFKNVRMPAMALTLCATLAAAMLAGCKKDSAPKQDFTHTLTVTEIAAGDVWDNVGITVTCRSDKPFGDLLMCCEADVTSDFSSSWYPKFYAKQPLEDDPLTYVCKGKLTVYKDRPVRYYVRAYLSDGRNRKGESDVMVFDAPADSTFDVSFTVSDVTSSSATVTAHFSRIVWGKSLNSKKELEENPNECAFIRAVAPDSKKSHEIKCDIPHDFHDSVFVAKFTDLLPNRDYLYGSLSQGVHTDPWPGNGRFSFKTLPD